MTYDIYYWDNGDEDTGGYWWYGGSSSTGAKITGTVSSNSTMKVNGIAVATVDNVTNETWEAYPPIPSGNGWTDYRPTSPTSGVGEGKITGGNSKNAKVNGKLIAVVGSQVTTCLDTVSTIEDGIDLINL
ncbi:hypothetical protein [Paenibacillus tianjinensis]|uniref:Uncharacterized protein n=1 Tax=Paenibacillus tianjinensis TaxID=2810347 RepID=A0ABX7L5Z5_9BACL|nr:hypothetical protein [Paenibacillus tianjinensis]QSF43553.1 hypothetical protein JRJ22_20035 [Paenibacillus tianjinensis]